MVIWFRIGWVVRVSDSVVVLDILNQFLVFEVLSFGFSFLSSGMLAVSKGSSGTNSFALGTIQIDKGKSS